jgi:hypothetical protein
VADGANVVNDARSDARRRMSGENVAREVTPFGWDSISIGKVSDPRV